MTTQSDFFNQPEPVALNAPADRPNKRVFAYDGQFFEDPGAEYSTEDVLSFLAQTYPELEQATWHSRTLPDGTEEITFVKVTGEKGLTPASLADRLAAGTRPATIEAVAVVNRLALAEGEPLPAAHLLELAPDIEAALAQAERISQASRRIVSRCLALKPTPLPRVPLGF